MEERTIVTLPNVVRFLDDVKDVLHAPVQTAHMRGGKQEMSEFGPMILSYLWISTIASAHSLYSFSVSAIKWRGTSVRSSFSLYHTINQRYYRTDRGDEREFVG